MMIPVFVLLLPALLQAPAAPKAEPVVTAEADRIEPSWRALGKNLWFDPAGKRLVIRSRVVLREGALEHLLCLKGTKEHEAILATDASPKMIHAGLLLTGAEKGQTVRFVPEFRPPTGSPIDIEVRWVEGGTTRTANARSWIVDLKNRPLQTDWVFSGSEEFPDRVTKEMLYAADDGDLITVANFPGAILDLPIASSSDDASRNFVPNTASIPPRDTPVLMFLRPRPKAEPKSR